VGGAGIIQEYILNKAMHYEYTNWIKGSELNPKMMFGVSDVES
jgi:hypothetical protein